MLFLLAVLCAMPQKPWAAKHKPLIFLLERLPLCRFSSSSLELDEEYQELESLSLAPATIAHSFFL
jgi:hypothetical protein